MRCISLVILLLTLTGCETLPCKRAFYDAKGSRQPCLVQSRAYSMALMKAGHTASIVIVDEGKPELHAVVYDGSRYYDTVKGRIFNADQIGTIKLIIPQEHRICQPQ